MSKYFDEFDNADLGTRCEKYLENGKIELKNIKVTQLEEECFALDIYWGDEEPFDEYDTYLYTTKKMAALDGLKLHVISLEKELEKSL